MNIKSFYVATLSSALDLELATPEDILAHATPDVLADHLPRPLWARLLTACVGAPKVDAQLVIETIGVPNLCEHVPTTLVWDCVSAVATRSLGGEARAPAPYQRAVSDSTLSTIAAPPEPVRSPLLTAPPPDEIAPAPVPERPNALGPSIPAPGSGEKSLADIVAELDGDERPAPRSRQPTSQRFRQSGGTGIGRLATARRPQASATSSVATEVNRTAKPPTGDEYEVETDLRDAQAREDWKANLAVEDEQLVDWSSSDETITGGDDLGGRKR